MMAMLEQPARIGHPVLGIVIPAVIFGFSFMVAWILYRHFTKKTD